MLITSSGAARSGRPTDSSIHSASIAPISFLVRAQCACVLVNCMWRFPVRRNYNERRTVGKGAQTRNCAPSVVRLRATCPRSAATAWARRREQVSCLDSRACRRLCPPYKRFTFDAEQAKQMKRVRGETRLLIADDHPLFRGALREAVSGLFERPDIAEAGAFEEVTCELDR